MNPENQEMHHLMPNPTTVDNTKYSATALGEHNDHPTLNVSALDAGQCANTTEDDPMNGLAAFAVARHAFAVASHPSVAHGQTQPQTSSQTPYIFDNLQVNPRPSDADDSSLAVSGHSIFSADKPVAVSSAQNGLESLISSSIDQESENQADLVSNAVDLERGQIDGNTSFNCIQQNSSDVQPEVNVDLSDNSQNSDNGQKLDVDPTSTRQQVQETEHFITPDATTATGSQALSNEQAQVLAEPMDQCEEELKQAAAGRIGLEASESADSCMDTADAPDHASMIPGDPRPVEPPLAASTPGAIGADTQDVDDPTIEKVPEETGRTAESTPASDEPEKPTVGDKPSEDQSPLPPTEPPRPPSPLPALFVYLDSHRRELRHYAFENRENRIFEYSYDNQGYDYGRRSDYGHPDEHRHAGPYHQHHQSAYGQPYSPYQHDPSRANEGRNEELEKAKKKALENLEAKTAAVGGKDKDKERAPPATPEEVAERLKARVSSLSRELMDGQTKIARLQDDLHVVEMERNRFEGSCRRNDEHISSLEKQLEWNRVENGKLRGNKQHFEAEAYQLRAECERLRKELSLTESTAHLEKNHTAVVLKSTQEQLSKQNNEVKRLEIEMASAKRENSSLRSENLKALASLDAAKRDELKLSEEYSSYSDRIKEMTSDNRVLVHEIDSARLRIKSLESSLKDRDGEYQALADAHGNVKKDLKDVTERLQDMCQKNGDLIRALEENAKYKKQAKQWEKQVESLFKHREREGQDTEDLKQILREMKTKR